MTDEQQLFDLWHELAEFGDRSWLPDDAALHLTAAIDAIGRHLLASQPKAFKRLAILLGYYASQHGLGSELERRMVERVERAQCPQGFA